MSKKIYGGWIIRECFGRLVRLMTGCQAPKMSIYLENFKARRAAR